MIALLTLLSLSTGSAAAGSAVCEPQFTYVSPKSIDLAADPRVGAEGVRVFLAIVLRGCLAKNAVRATRHVILLKDGTSIGLSETDIKKYKPSEIPFGDATGKRPSPPRIGNVRAVDDARLRYYNLAGTSIEQRVGVWRVGGRSVIACYDVVDGRTGAPRTLFTSAERFGSIETMIGLPHGETIILTLLADRGRGNKLAVSFAWYGRGCGETDVSPPPPPIKVRHDLIDPVPFSPRAGG